MEQIIIHNNDFTDANGELYYLNTGRDNVSGLNYPNNYMRNNNYSYIRVLNMRLSPDTSLVYPIHECFLLTTIKNDGKIISNIVNVDALIKSGTVDTINITCNPLNHFSVSEADQVHDIKASLKSYLNTSSSMQYSLGIWLHSKCDTNIIIKKLSSLAINEIPNNIQNQFLRCDYEAFYLDNEKMNVKSNTAESENEIGKKIADSKNANQSIIDSIKNFDHHCTVTGDTKYLTVLYCNPKIEDAHVDKTIRPDCCEYLDLNNAFIDIRYDYIRARQIGNYIIALKVDVDIVGESDLEVAVYINNEKVKELSSHMHLNSNDKVKVFGFLAGQIQKQLLPSDKIYLKMRWSNNDIEVRENRCQLQMIKL